MIPFEKPWRQFAFKVSTEISGVRCSLVEGMRIAKRRADGWSFSSHLPRGASGDNQLTIQAYSADCPLGLHRSLKALFCLELQSLSPNALKRGTRQPAVQQSSCPSSTPRFAVSSLRTFRISNKEFSFYILDAAKRSFSGYARRTYNQASQLIVRREEPKYESPAHVLESREKKERSENMLPTQVAS